MPEMPPLPEPVATALELTGFGDCDFYTDAQMHAYARQYAAALEAERDAYKEAIRAITVEGSVVVVRSEYEKMAKAEAERGVPAAAVDPAAAPAWRPIDTMPEGVHVLLWFPNGENGAGGIETATVYRSNHPDSLVPWSFWTHGGPNGGNDWDADELPTHWMPLPAPPAPKA